MPGKRPSPQEGPTLSIGALARATGVPVETIRTWERRYGVPQALRRPSGHRLYPLEAVAHLRRAVRALERGHRPADVLRLPLEQLDSLLDHAAAATVAESAPRHRGRPPGKTTLPDMLRWLASYDGPSLQAALESAALSRPPLEFMEKVVVPLMRLVGREWEKGRLDVRHEHFASARVAEVLSALRRRHERPGPGPVAVFGLLPGDAHELGLLMASVLFSVAGWRVVYLGPSTPHAQFVALARDVAIDAVVVGVSGTAPPAAVVEELATLRRGLPASLPLLVGGAGAPARVAGATVLSDLRSLDRWLAHRGTPRSGSPPART